jgi:hypothetical protein
VLRDALDPAACAEARRQEGSSSPDAMEEMLVGVRASLTDLESWSAVAHERQAAAERALLDRARDLS